MVFVEDRSILKKISAVIVMITALVFFSYFHVFGTTYEPQTYNSYTDSITYNGLTYYVKVTQLKATSEGTSMLPGGMETIMLVQLQMTNNSNTIVKAGTIPKLSIDLRDSGSVITNVYSYGGDFTLGLLTGGTCVFYPSSEFSLDNNKVVVPPGKSLSFVGALGLPATLDQTGSSTLDNGLRGVHLYDKANYQVTDGDYAYGEPVDLSEVINAIEELIDTVSTSDELSAIISAILYPSTHTITNNESSSYQTSKTLLSTNNVYVYSYVRPSINFIENDVQYIEYLDTGLMGTHQLVDYCLDQYLIIRNANVNASYALSYGIFNLRQTITRPSGWTYITKFMEECDDSNITYTITTINDSTNLFRVALGQRMKSNNSYVWLYPNATQFVHIKVHRIYRLDELSQNASLDYQWIFVDNTAVADSASLGVARSTGYDDFIFEEREVVNRILRDFNLYLDAYANVNGLDDFNNNSDDVADVSDSNHIIEESYYSANASAIEATGLSNYRFSNEQNNGIGKVADDFMLLWNALGSWNGVYIFSLTMALATFIMRHGGLFTIKRRTSDKGGEE